MKRQFALYCEDCQKMVSRLHNKQHKVSMYHAWYTLKLSTLMEPYRDPKSAFFKKSK